MFIEVRCWTVQGLGKFGIRVTWSVLGAQEVGRPATRALVV